MVMGCCCSTVVLKSSAAYCGGSRSVVGLRRIIGDNVGMLLVLVEMFVLVAVVKVVFGWLLGLS